VRVSQRDAYINASGNVPRKKRGIPNLNVGQGPSRREFGSWTSWYSSAQDPVVRSRQSAHRLVTSARNNQPFITYGSPGPLHPSQDTSTLPKRKRDGKSASHYSCKCKGVCGTKLSKIPTFQSTSTPEPPMFVHRTTSGWYKEQGFPTHTSWAIGLVLLALVNACL